MPRNTAISKAQLKNVIKISINHEKKKRKHRRRKTTRKRQADAQMDLITSLASKPSMRAVEQRRDDAQNNLITSSLVATNAGIIQALNNLNTPAFSGSFAPENPFTAPEIPEDPNAPPDTPAGKHAEKDKAR